MKGFGIEIKNNLLEPKHVKSMGQAVWLYMLLLDKLTSIDEEEHGHVLYDRALQFEKDIKPELGISKNTYTRWIAALEKYPYIGAVRLPEGIKFTVLKAKKRFRRNGDTPSPRMVTPLPTNAESSIQSSVNNTKNHSATSAGADPWTQKELGAYLSDIMENGTAPNQIIAEFLGWKNVGVTTGAIRIKNRKEASALIGRYSRTANQLAKTYPQPEVFRKIAILGEHAPFDWQLENVLKYMAYSDDHLAETMKKMKGRQ